MEITLIQMALSNDIGENLARHMSYLERAGPGIYVFPECSLTGYGPEAFKGSLGATAIERLASAVDDLASVAGRAGCEVIAGAASAEDGRLYNAALRITPQGKETVYRKMNLTEDERGVFHAGVEPAAFDARGRTFGLMICRDQSDRGLFEALKQRGAESIVIQSAHYYSPEEALWKMHKNVAIPVARAVDFGLNVLKVNAVGVSGDRLSHGRTLAVNRHGRILRMLDSYGEGALTVNVDSTGGMT
jgi:predicted amidohydrolase